MHDPQEAEPKTTAPNDGCLVDWSWLDGREIASATSSLDKLVISFRDGETLTVQASNWKGKPFLAFTPWKPRSG